MSARTTDGNYIKKLLPVCPEKATRGKRKRKKRTKMAILKLFLLNANSKTRMATAKLFALHANTLM